MRTRNEKNDSNTNSSTTATTTTTNDNNNNNKAVKPANVSKRNIFDDDDDDIFGSNNYIQPPPRKKTNFGPDLFSIKKKTGEEINESTINTLFAKIEEARELIRKTAVKDSASRSCIQQTSALIRDLCSTIKELQNLQSSSSSNY